MGHQAGREDELSYFQATATALPHARLGHTWDRWQEYEQSGRTYTAYGDAAGGICQAHSYNGLPSERPLRRSI